MFRSRRFGAAPAAVVLVALVSAGCGGGDSTTGADPRVVRVVAAENFWGDIAAQIGGANASVRSIITDPTADPHQYESDARDAASVADAQLVIENGLGYDDFVDKLLANTANDRRVVRIVAQVLHVRGDGANPHLWYDLPAIPDVAASIEAVLAAADPADAAGFATNLKAFDASLAPLQRLVAEIRTKYTGAPVAYTERVPGYLLAAAGLTVVSPPGFASAIEDGNEPSAGDARAMDDLIAHHRIKALLVNAQATSSVTDDVQARARRAGVPVVAVTETQPRGAGSYQSWQRQQLVALLAALGG